MKTLIVKDKSELLRYRDELLETTNKQGVMSGPIWALINHLTMRQICRRGDLSNSEWRGARVVNLPSNLISKR